MAKVPDLFEDLKNCFSENEEYSSAIDHLSLTQKSFYDASYEPLHEGCVNKVVSLSTSETSVSPNLTFQENVVAVTASGKILKKRRLSLNQPITDVDLEANVSDPEEGIIQPRSVPSIFQRNMRYKYLRIIKQEFVLNDALNQSLVRDISDQYLRAAPLQNMGDAVKFDMGVYMTSDDSILPVTLRISQTSLFVSAQNEDEPVLLKEIPQTPRIITDSESDILFFWESQGNKNYFKSAANPQLFIATKPEHLVHMARGLPSMTEFQIS